MSEGSPRRLFGVLGHPIAHSLSPKLQQAALDALGVSAEFLAFDVPLERFDAELADLYERGAEGLSVTAPLKARAFEASVEKTPEARASGVANCLRRSRGGYHATNTDGSGFVAFAADVSIAIAGKRVVLLGGGGSAAGLVPALEGMSARCTVIARDPARAHALAGLARAETVTWGSSAADEALAVASLVINATTLGAKPGEPLPCDSNLLAPGATVVDLRYAPRRTPWLAAAAVRGLRAFDGLGLLVHQGAESLRFWLDRAPPLDRLRAFVGWKPLPLRADGSVEE